MLIEIMVVNTTSFWLSLKHIIYSNSHQCVNWFLIFFMTWWVNTVVTLPQYPENMISSTISYHISSTIQRKFFKIKKNSSLFFLNGYCEAAFMIALGQGPEGGPCTPLHGKGLVKHYDIYIFIFIHITSYFPLSYSAITHIIEFPVNLQYFFKSRHNTTTYCLRHCQSWIFLGCFWFLV